MKKINVVKQKNLYTLEYIKIKNLLVEMATSQMGKDFCDDIVPLNNINIIKKMLSETTEAVNLILARNSLPLNGIKDIRNILGRVKLGGVLSCEELTNIADFLRICDKMKQYAKDYNGVLYDLFFRINLIDDLKSLIEKKVDKTSLFDNASQNLFALRRNIRDINTKIRETLNNFIMRSKDLLQDNIFYIKNNRYCLPVKCEYKNSFSGIIHDQSSSGATIFIEPQNIINLNNRLKELYLQENAEIDKILCDLSFIVKEKFDLLADNIYIIGKLDFIFARGELSIAFKCTEPILNQNGYINFKNARHPLIDSKKVVPINIYLGKDFNTLLITGPNTGGKTVVLKTVGLLVLMAQSGLHIPVDEKSETAVFNNIFVDIGDEQSIEQNLSTFSAHMKNINEIIKLANQDSLILLDELGAGTDPTEGSALAIAILEYFLGLKSKVIVTSHYSELKIYAMSTKGVENASCEFDLNTLSPTYKLLIGTPGKSNAFAISKKIGLNKNIINTAQKYIKQKDIIFEDVIKNLDDMQININKKHEQAEKMFLDAEILKNRLENERKNFYLEKNNLLEKARKEALEIINLTKQKANLLLKNYRDNKFKEAEKIKLELKDQEKNLIEKNKTRDLVNNKNHELDKYNIKIGQKVFCVSLNKIAVVKSLPDKNNKIKIALGALSSKVNISDLRSYSQKDLLANNKINKSCEPKRYYISQKKLDISPEINVHGFMCEEALNLIDKYIDDAILAGLSQIKIVHGKGTGALRKSVNDYLKKNTSIKSFRLGNFGEGDIGVTIVYL